MSLVPRTPSRPYLGIFFFVCQGCPSRKSLPKVVSPPSFSTAGNLSQMLQYIRVQKARHRSRVICLFIFEGCPSLLYVVGAYPISILSHIRFSCAFSPEVIHIPHNSYRLFSLLVSFLCIWWNSCPYYHLLVVCATPK